MSKRILSEIWIYPIKSLGGIRLPASRVLKKGLLHDRRWMLVNEKNEFLTQRAFPAMARFKMKFDKDAFRVTHEGDSILVPFAVPAEGMMLKAQIWADQVDVVDMGTTFNEWFSKRLGFSCKLVAFPEASPRPVPQSMEDVSLADGFPLMMIGQASLGDLNARLEVPVPMNRFRPNLVFEGGLPYEEDSLKDFTVGKNRFMGVRPCSRCVLTTVDQLTGEKGREPLLTLSRYRKVQEHIYFGQNVIAVDCNEINEGDEITF